MATAILDQDRSSTIPSTGEGAPKFVARDVEDDLNDAAHWLTLVHWIGAARSMLDGLAAASRAQPELVDYLRGFEVYPTDPDWTAAEDAALRHLHQAAGASVRDVQKRLGLR